MMIQRLALTALSLAMSIHMVAGFCQGPLAMSSTKGARTCGLELRMQSGPGHTVSRRSLLEGAVGIAVLSSGAVSASATEAKQDIVRLENGLSFQDKVKKTGPLANLEQSVAPGDLVVVNYIAYLRDGTIFDNTVKRGKPVAFQLGKKQVIPGLETGLLGMKAGEQRRLFVPARLAYGDRGVCFDDKSKGCLVPPNTDLVYDVTLERVAVTPQ